MRIIAIGVFVPFLGDFLSIKGDGRCSSHKGRVFVPFLGDFLSILASQTE